MFSLFVGAIGLTIWGLRADAIRDANNDTNNVATILSVQIDRSIQSVDTVLSEIREMAKAYSTSNSDAAIRTRIFHDLLHEQLRRVSHADVAAVIGADGIVANSTTQWPPTGTDVRDRDYFIHMKHALSDEIYISTLMRNRVSGERTVFLSKRISGTNGEFRGLVLIGIKLSYFEGIYHSIKSLRDRSFVLLHPNGTKPVDISV